MSSPYEELKAITDAVYAGQPTEFAQEVIALLGKHGIELRQDDGCLHEVTFSIARSQVGTLVVGLRYEKCDGTFTEDTFIFQPEAAIVKCYGKKIETLLPEYRGTHKAPPTYPAPAE